MIVFLVRESVTSLVPLSKVSFYTLEFGLLDKSPNRSEREERKFVKPISRLICVLGIGHLYLKGSKTSHFTVRANSTFVLSHRASFAYQKWPSKVR